MSDLGGRSFACALKPPNTEPQQEDMPKYPSSKPGEWLLGRFSLCRTQRPWLNCGPLAKELRLGLERNTRDLRLEAFGAETHVPGHLKSSPLFQPNNKYQEKSCVQALCGVWIGGAESETGRELPAGHLSSGEAALDPSAVDFLGPQKPHLNRSFRGFGGPWKLLRRTFF